jgi:hypothetical protein
MSKRTCSKCDLDHHALGLCRNHYMQMYRKGHCNPVSSGLPAKVPTTIVDYKPAQSEPGFLHPYDRAYMRTLWMRAQGHRCAVCNAAAWQYPEEGGVYGFFRLSIDRSCCKPSRLCCIRGTVCYACLRPVEVLASDRMLTPSKSIHGMTISEWTASAVDFLKFDRDQEY